MRLLEPVIISPSLIDSIESVSTEPGDGGVCWKCRDGRIVVVRQMDDNHLENTVRFLGRQPADFARGVYHSDGSRVDTWSRDAWAEYLKAELCGRGTAL